MDNPLYISFLLYNAVFWGTMIPLIGFFVLSLMTSLRQSRFAPFLVILLTTITLGCNILLAMLTSPIVPSIWAFPWISSADLTLELGFHLDSISVTMGLFVLVIAWIVQLYSLYYLKDESVIDKGRYYLWHILFVFAMNLLVYAPNLLQFFLGWELVGLCSYLLIGFQFKKYQATWASTQAFLFTKFSDLGFLAAIVILITQFQQLDWLTEEMQFAPDQEQWIMAVGFFLLIAVIGKSAQFPLHVWLKGAMQGPTPVSALLHAATMVAIGIYLLVRNWTMISALGVVLDVMLYVGLITAVVSGILACISADLKETLAYSTSSQLGLMLASIGCGNPDASYFHLLSHAGFKALLFLSAGLLIHAYHGTELHRFGKAFQEYKWLSLSFLIGLLSLMGFPFTAGFWSKDWILEGLFLRTESKYIAMLILVLTGFYSMRLAYLVLFAKAKTAILTLNDHPTERISPWVQSLLFPLVILSLGFGFLADFFDEKWRLYGQVTHHAIRVWPTALLMTSVGVIMAFYHSRRAQAIYVAEQWTLPSLQGFYGWIWEMAKLKGRVFAWIDRYLIDALFNGIAYLSLWVGDGFKEKNHEQKQASVSTWFLIIIALIVALFYRGLGG